MINLTDHIQVLDHDNLDFATRASTSAALEHLIKRYGPPPPQRKWKSNHAIHFILNDTNMKGEAIFDEAFLQASLAFTSTTSQNRSSRIFFDTLENYVENARPGASAINSIKQGVKIILVELWNQGIVLLPTVFASGPHFNPIPHANELYDFLMSYAPSSQLRTKSSRGMHTEAFRMLNYMPRILRTTSWKKVEDVCIHELADLHRAQRLYIRGQSQIKISTCPFPWLLFLKALLNAFPGRVSYNDEQLKLYSQWSLSITTDQRPFSEFSPKQKKQQRKIRSSLGKKVQIPSATDRLKTISRETSHNAALLYFENYKQSLRGNFDWLNETPNYPGREHVVLKSSVKLWRDSFRAYLHYRSTVKGYESDKQAISSLNILADYLFLYLPWWKELFPKSRIEIPNAPKEFLRYTFVYRSEGEDISAFPVTFLEIIKLRRHTQDSQYGAVKQIQLFFKFIEGNFLQEENISGPSFRSPILSEFDMPKVAKRGKTSKIVFPKSSYGYLLNYGYAVEAFGQFLLERCLSHSFTDEELRALSSSRMIDTATWGYMPYVLYRGKILPLTSVPNMFTWTERCIQTPSLPNAVRVIPHLTTLRMLCVAVETGLRVVALRWLDRRTWDKYNFEHTTESSFSFHQGSQYVYSLYINTDKTKETPWDTFIVFRVRSQLLRELQFQLSINEPDMDVECAYQNRPLSRFGQILPLFRSSSQANPVTSNTYYKAWALYMIGFQSFLTGATGIFIPFIKVEPKGSTKENPKIIRDENGNEYCPVSILAISTPHACRASFATNRQGILETSDMADLLGHAGPVVTEYYQSPRAEDLQKKLELSDKAIQGEYHKFNKADAAYIRADKGDSALVRSFTSNRESTMATFGFMPSVSLWNIGDYANMNEDAVEQLRNGPMSLIRFRETHICPVGEECPSDIVQAIGGFKRCGMCPLALRCIDHLPAISAQKHALLERIIYLSRQKDELESAGENESAEAIWDELDLEINELLGWQLSEEILSKMYSDHIKNGDDSTVFHAERPDIVKRHLTQVAKQTEPAEFLLHRLAEANAYPSLQSPDIRAVAANIRRRLLAGNDVPDLATELPSAHDVTVAASLLRTAMQAHNLTIKDVSLYLTSNKQVALPSTGILQIGASE